MDNLGNNSSHSDAPDKPIPLPDGPSGPVAEKENPAGSAPPVSRAPLSLGGTGAPVANPAPAAHPTVSTSAPRVQTPMPVRRPVAAAPAARITNCRTFFTKLHPGAIKFMDDQITAWLKENPGVVIKRTNAVTGEIVDKKTEPSILITIWY
jgi:hypothetical protein